MGAHSHLGASSAKRWMTCPGSFHLVENVQKSGSSVYAAQGTVAHALAEGCLDRDVPASSGLGQFSWMDGYEIVVDDEMVRTVQVYLDAVHARIVPGVTVHHETRVNLDPWWTQEPRPPTPMFGTADTWLFNPANRRLTILDFKYGAGVYVPVQDNPQLLYYAAGVLLLIKTPVRDVEIVVVQPRARGQEPVRVDVIDYLDLRLWIDMQLKPAVAAVREPDAVLLPGTHCRFCDARSTCPAKAEQANEEARNDFDVVEDT